MREITVRTYAKINLSLDVTGVRENGYHDVAMVMQAVDLCDYVTVRAGRDAEHGGISLTCSRADVPADERNTAWKAAAAMLREHGCGKESGGSGAEECSGAEHGCGEGQLRVEIHIDKRIPAAAGMAGGSSDAAGVLLALNSVLELGLDLDELCRIGTEIGADVPFCIMAMAHADESLQVRGGAGCALAEGIGEILTPMPSVDMWAVLAKPSVGISTPETYKAYDSVKECRHPDTEAVIKGIKENNRTIMASGMANVLESVTLRDHSEVMELKRIMAAYSEGITLMSGSGPTVFSLFEEKDAALKALESVKAELSEGKCGKCEVFCVRTVR